MLRTVCLVRFAGTQVVGCSESLPAVSGRVKALRLRSVAQPPHSRPPRWLRPLNVTARLTPPRAPHLPSALTAACCPSLDLAGFATSTCVQRRWSSKGDRRDTARNVRPSATWVPRSRPGPLHLHASVVCTQQCSVKAGIVRLAPAPPLSAPRRRVPRPICAASVPHVHPPQAHPALV
jgi:hypothetical protein